MTEEYTAPALSLNELVTPEPDTRPPKSSSSANSLGISSSLNDNIHSKHGILVNNTTNMTADLSSSSTDGWGGEGDDTNIPLSTVTNNNNTTGILQPPTISSSAFSSSSLLLPDNNPYSSIAAPIPLFSITTTTVNDTMLDKTTVSLSSSLLPSSSTTTTVTTNAIPLQQQPPQHPQPIRTPKYPPPRSPSLHGSTTASYSSSRQQHTVSSSPSYVKPNYSSTIATTPPTTTSLFSSSSYSTTNVPGSPNLTAGSRTSPYYSRNRSVSRAPSESRYPKGETGITSSSSARRQHSRSSHSRGGENLGRSTSLHYRRSLSIAQEEQLQKNTRKNKQTSVSSVYPPPPPLFVNRAITVTRATRRLPSRSMSVARTMTVSTASRSESVHTANKNIPSNVSPLDQTLDDDRSSSYTEHSHSRSRSRLRSLPRGIDNREVKYDDKEDTSTTALTVFTEIEKSWQNVLKNLRDITQSSSTDTLLSANTVPTSTPPSPPPLPTFPRTNLCTILPNGIILWPCYTYRKEKSAGQEQWRNHLRLAFTHTKEVQNFDNFMDYNPYVDNNNDGNTGDHRTRWPFIRLIDIECIDEYGLRKSIPNHLLDGGSCVRVNDLGDHICIVSAYGVLVVRIPSILCEPHAYEISIVTHPPTNILVPAIATLIQPSIDDSLDGFTPVDARWHPVCPDYVVVLTIDCLRIFYIGKPTDPLIFRCVQEYTWDRASLRSPPTAFSFGSESIDKDSLTEKSLAPKNDSTATKSTETPQANSTSKTEQQTNSSSTTEEVVRNGVPLWPWNPLTVYIACADGSLYLLCPVLPPNANVPMNYYRTLLDWSQNQDKADSKYRNIVSVERTTNGNNTSSKVKEVNSLPSFTTSWLLQSFYTDGPMVVTKKDTPTLPPTMNPSPSPPPLPGKVEQYVMYRHLLHTSSSLSGGNVTSLPSELMIDPSKSFYSSSLSAINYPVPVLRGPLTSFPNVRNSSSYNPNSVAVDIRIVPLSKRVINRNRTALMLLFSDGKVICMYFTAPIAPVWITSSMIHSVASMYSSTGNKDSIHGSITITNVSLRHHDLLRIRIPRPDEIDSSKLSILIVDAVDLTLTKKRERKLRKGTLQPDDTDETIIGWPIFVPVTRMLRPVNDEDNHATVDPSKDTSGEEDGFSTVIMGSKVFALSHLWSQQTAVWVNAMASGSTIPTLFVECLGDVRNYDTQRGWKAEWRTKLEYAGSDTLPSSLLPPEPPLVIAGIMNYTSTTSRGLIIATVRAGDIGIHGSVPEIMVKDMYATAATVKSFDELVQNIPVDELCQHYKLPSSSVAKIVVGMLVQEPRTIDFAFYQQPLSSLFLAIPELGSEFSTNTIAFDRYEALRTNPHLYGKDSVFMRKVTDSSAQLRTIMDKFEKMVKESKEKDNTMKFTKPVRPLTIDAIQDTSLAVHVSSLFDENNNPLPTGIDRTILEEEKQLRIFFKDNSNNNNEKDNSYIPITRIEHNCFADTVDQLLTTVNALAELETTNTHVWHYVSEAGAHLEYRDFYPDLKEAINHVRYRTESLSLRAQYILRNHELLKTRTETLLYTMALLNPKLTPIEKRFHNQLKSIHESLTTGIHHLRLDRFKQQFTKTTNTVESKPPAVLEPSVKASSANTIPPSNNNVINGTTTKGTVPTVGKGTNGTAVSLLDLLKTRTSTVNTVGSNGTGGNRTYSSSSSNRRNENGKQQSSSSSSVFLENLRKEQVSQQLYQQANNVMDTAYKTRRYAEELRREIAVVLRNPKG